MGTSITRQQVLESHPDGIAPRKCNAASSRRSLPAQAGAERGERNGAAGFVNRTVQAGRRAARPSEIRVFSFNRA